MDTLILEGILARQEPGRTLFPYFKDQYAVDLLRRSVGTGAPVRELKHSAYAGLLKKPVVQQILAHCADGWVTPEHLETAWCYPAQTAIETYRLTLGRWGGRQKYWEQGYYQTSRPGENLVVQLNFSNEHNHAYERLIRPQGSHPFVSRSHPTRSDGDFTLAWCRVDLDLETGEALIEEVQNDWLRYADSHWTWAKKRSDWIKAHWNGRAFYPSNYHPAGRLSGLEAYVTEVLRPHRQLWAEAVLAATLAFLQEDLDIRTVYFHTYEGGARFKGMSGSRSPRSLYTALPKRFGFRRTRQMPLFLRRVRRARKVARTHAVSLFRLDTGVRGDA